MNQEHESEIIRCPKCRQDFEADNTIAGHQCPRCSPKPRIVRAGQVPPPIYIIDSSVVDTKILETLKMKSTPKSLDAALQKLAEKFNQGIGKKD